MTHLWRASNTNTLFLTALLTAVYNCKNTLQKFPSSSTQSLIMDTGMLHDQEDDMY